MVRLTDSGRLYQYFYAYFETCSTPTAETLFLLVLSMLALELAASMELKRIPKLLESQPVFLCIDDTMVPKSGRKFENVSKFFDYAAHNGSNYLNGHCFVSLMLCVPVMDSHKVVYQAVPLGYCMRQKEKSKLALAASMVRPVLIFPGKLEFYLIKI